jgi:hypothetical protein
MKKKKKKKDQRTSTLYIRYVPANLKAYFKAYCAKREKTMADVIVEFMHHVTKTAQDLDQRDE